MRAAVLARGKQAFVLAQAQNLAGHLDLAWRLAVELERAREGSITFEPVFADDLARYRRMAAEMDRCLARARRIARFADADPIIAQVTALSRQRAGRLVHDLGERAGGHARGRDLTGLLEQSRGLSRSLKDLSLLAETTVDTIVAESRAAHRVAPAAFAGRLARGAVRVLPIMSRARYRDEFESELYELAAAKASRWTQALYGLRLLDRAWVLRAELRLAARRRVRS